jgi:hypothetical protein
VVAAASTMVFEEECVLGCLEIKMSSSFSVLRGKKQVIG